MDNRTCTSTHTGTDTSADSDTDTESDTDTGDVLTCIPVGVYVDKLWELSVDANCSARLFGKCVKEMIDSLRTTGDGWFNVDLTWHWQGGGAGGGATRRRSPGSWRWA